MMILQRQQEGCEVGVVSQVELFPDRTSCIINRANSPVSEQRNVFGGKI
jgi:hypothetical protein